MRRWSGSLKLRLALASGAIIALSAVAVSLAVLHDSAERTEQAILDNEAADADLMAGVLQQHLIQLQVALRAAAQPIDARVLDDAAAQTAYLQHRQVLSTLFSNIALVAADGRVLALRNASGISRPALSLADQACFRQTLQQGVPLICEPLLGRLSRRPEVMLTMPVAGSGPGPDVEVLLVGTLGLSAPDLLSRMAAPVPDGRSQMQTVITDANGVILSHADPALLLKPAESVPGLQAAVMRWVKSGRPIEVQAQAVNDDGYMVAQAGVPGAGWMVFRIGPTEALLGGFDQAVRRAVAYGVAVALLGMLVLGAWLAWLLRPLDRLEKRTLALGSEGLGLEEGWPDAPGEVGGLERALRVALRERARAEASNAELFGKLRSVMSTAPMGLAFTRARHFELVSDEWDRLLGYPAGALVGQPARLIYASEADYEQLGPRVFSAFSHNLPFVGDFEFVRHDGSRFIGELHGRPVNARDPSAGTIWLLRDVTQEREAHRELAWSANHDELTGLANRRHFEHEVARLLAQRQHPVHAEGERMQAMAALFIDLDRFKQVNDGAGHAAGDRVLREVARVLLSCVRRDELVARLGGDEFAILLTGCDQASAERVADKIRQAVEDLAVPWGEQVLGVGTSVGVVEIPPGTPDVASILNAADLACYAAKQAGRNAVRSGAMPGLRLVATRSA